MKHQPKDEPVLDFGEAYALDPEPFIGPAEAASFLGIKVPHLLKMARAGDLPAYPISRGKRRTWRFKKTDLNAAVCAWRTDSPALPSWSAKKAGKAGK